MKKLFILLNLIALPGLNAEVLTITLPPETTVFKVAPGVQLASGQCMTCHSTDYIAMQPPKGLDFWEGEVKKMQGKYGAPIATNDLEAIAVYLAKNYGTGVPAATPVVVATQSSGPLDGKALATRDGCFNCHRVDLKLIGPAYKDVAAKYHDKADALEKVKHQIIHGGYGQWGNFPMPAFPEFTPEQLDTLAHWVLAQ